MTLGNLYGQSCAKAGKKNLYTNSNIYFVNSDFVRWYGGYGFYTNNTSESLSGRVKLGRTVYPDLEHFDIMGNRLDTEIVPVENKKSSYQIYLDLQQPLAPGQFYPYAWARDETTELQKTPFSSEGKYLLKMHNQFGMHAFEVFYLVVPNYIVVEYEENAVHAISKDGKAIRVPVENTSKQTVGDYTIYAWEKEVQAKDNHSVTVYLSKKKQDDEQVIFKDSFEQGDTSPTDWQMGANVEGVKYHWDRENGSDGTSSLCMKKNVQKYFPIAQWTRTIEHSGDAKELSVSANVRAQKASKAIIDALFLNDQGQWIKHEWVSYIGAKEAGDKPANHNWKPYTGTVDIPEGTQQIVIGLQMYGPGAVWFDEVEVAYVSDGDQDEAGVNEPDPLKAEDLTAEGWKLWGQRKLSEAESKFKEAIANDPDHENAYQGLGWAQLNQGKKKNAEASFKKCVKLNPSNSAALNGLGWIAHGNGDKDTAVKWWEKAVTAFPGATASLSGLTQVYMEQGDYAKAVKYYQMWLKAEPNNQQATDGLKKAQELNQQ